MNKKLFFASITIILLSACSVVGQKGPSVSTAAFTNLTGCWQGTLNYSGTIIRKPYSTPATLVVRQIGKSNQFVFLHTYTTDPKDALQDTITISKDGRMLNKGPIKSKRSTTDGDLEIITESQGFDHDNNIASVIRQTYSFGKERYVYKKQVQLQGQTDWLDRQEFNYLRTRCNPK